MSDRTQSVSNKGKAMAPQFKVLVATDSSKHTRAAVAMLLRLPLPEQVEATVLKVTPKLDPNLCADAIIKQLSEDAERFVSNEAKQLAEFGWQTRTLVREGHTAEQIVAAARELVCDLVVVGSHGMTGISRFMLGSVAQKVVKYANCSVLVGRVRDEPVSSGSSDVKSADVPPMRLLLAFDGSETANAAVALLSAIPLRDRSDVTVLGALTVTTKFNRMDITEQTLESWGRRKVELKAELDAAAERLRKATPHVRVILRENGPDPSREILDAARQLDADLIVVGHKGKSAIKRFLMGSVSNRVLHHSDRSVLVVRP